MKPRRRTPAIAALVLFLTSCFSEPVVEKLEIDFRHADGVIVTASVEIRGEAVEASPLAVRLDRLRDDLLFERDFWSTRFSIASHGEDEYRRERSKGKISKVTRSALIDRQSLARMMTGFAELSFIAAPEWEEVGLAVAKSDRATSAEKRFVDGELNRWSQRYSAYVAAVARLLTYLGEHSDRGPYVAARVLQRDGLPGKFTEVELTEDEDELVRLVNDSSDAVIAMLSEQNSTAYTFEEMTRRIYDPFPAEITILTPGAIVECEGFLCGDDRRARIPKLSLVGSLPRLQRWVSPDPLMMQMDERKGDLDAQLDLFFAKPFSIAPTLPSAGDIRRAVESLLTPASTYRLRWRLKDEIENQTLPSTSRQEL